VEIDEDFIVALLAIIDVLAVASVDRRLWGDRAMLVEMSSKPSTGDRILPQIPFIRCVAF